MMKPRHVYLPHLSRNYKRVSQLVAKDGDTASVLRGKELAGMIAQSQLARVDGYIKRCTNLGTVFKGIIMQTRNNLEKHVRVFERRTTLFATCLGIVELSKAHRPLDGIDITPATARAILPDARNEARQAEKTLIDLINELATFCPGIGSPYQVDTLEPGALVASLQTDEPANPCTVRPCNLSTWLHQATNPKE